MASPPGDIRFDGRVVVITGAAGALGRSYARAFASRGAKLVLNDPGVSSRGDGACPDLVQSLVDEVRAAGGTAVADSHSVADTEGARQVIARAVGAFGRVDVLVNDAGAMRDSAFRKMNIDDFAAVVDVNLTGTARVTHAVFPLMVAQQYGRILMTTSASGLYGVFGAANYAAAKMGVVGLMNALRIEGARHGVLVNCIAPLAASRLTRDFLGASVRERLSPDLVTPLMLLLASERCAVSGDVLVAGGGHFARASVIEGRGIDLAGDGLVTPEQLLERIDDIRDLRGARSFHDSLEAVAGALEPEGERISP